MNNRISGRSNVLSTRCAPSVVEPPEGGRSTWRCIQINGTSRSQRARPYTGCSIPTRRSAGRLALLCSPPRKGADPRHRQPQRLGQGHIRCFCIALRLQDISLRDQQLGQAHIVLETAKQCYALAGKGNCLPQIALIVRHQCQIIERKAERPLHAELAKNRQAWLSEPPW